MHASPLSVALIVKNEAAVLERCLRSVLAITPNVLVVDTGSTDDTKQIAQGLGAVVVDFAWIDDFSAARNFSFEEAAAHFPSCPWMMWLDADDVIFEEDAAKIRRLFAFPIADSIDSFISTYVYASDQRGHPVSLVPRERIMRVSARARWQGVVHEAVSVNLAKASVVDFRVTHMRPAGRSPNERNIRLYDRLASVVGIESFASRDLYYYARELCDASRQLEAEPLLESFVAHADAWWEDKASAYLLLARAAQSAGNAEQARRRAAEATAIKHSSAEAYCLLGELCVADGQWKAAVHWYEIAAAIELPADAIGIADNTFYTWVPHLQLCLCYAQLGDLVKAREHNELAAKWVPDHSSIAHNRKLIGKDRAGQGKRLNLGCGGKRMEGYVNCDLYQIPGVDEAFSLDNIPYANGTISAIHSEHALEHLPRAQSHAALREWARVLAPGGELLLKVPDLVGCCAAFVANPHLRWWYDWTIYGKQQGLSGEPDAGQFHQCGYTQELLGNLLAEAGFVVDYNETYDGFDTPSISVRAVRRRAAWTIGWLVHENWDEAGTRIRALNVNRWLRARGYDSRIVTPEQIERNPEAYTFVVAGKRWDAAALDSLYAYKAAGGQVILDINEDYGSMNWHGFGDAVKTADAIVTCSAALAEKVQFMTETKCSVTVISDGVETPINLNCEYLEKSRLSAVWNGYGGNSELAERLRPILNECGYDLVTIHEQPSADVKWERETWPLEMIKHDIAICPQRPNQPCKSANKLTTAMALGLPAVASDLAAYDHVVGQDGWVEFATTDEEWRQSFMFLREAAVRRRNGEAGKAAVVDYLSDAICMDWVSVLQSLLEGAKPVVDIIIPTYNNPELLDACLRSIAASTTIRHTLTIVDVGQDRNVDHDRMKMEMEGGACVSYRLIKPVTKTSFSASNNLALRTTSSPYVMLLNDDTIVTPGWLESLKSAVDEQGCGIAGPFSNCDQGWLHDENIFIDGLSLHPNMALEQVSSRLNAIYEYGRQRSAGPARRMQQPWFAFYAVLMTRKVIDEVGLLDETFVNGGEDVDFCKRAARLGYRTVQCLDNFVLHFGGKSRKVSPEQDPDAHKREDTFNNRWLQVKYSRPTVVIYTGPAYERWSPKSLVEGGIGGSETAVIHMAKELTKLGNRVVVFNDCGQGGSYDEVTYKPFTEFPAFADMNFIDLFISSRDIDVFRLPIRAETKLCWVHDIWLSPTSPLPPHAAKVDKFLCLSRWHKEFFAAHHRVAADRIDVTRNGIDVSRFKPAAQLVRDPQRLIYSSSPDRGLDVLLEWWPDIRAASPQANLRVFYGFDNWNKALAQSGDKTQIAFRDRIMSLLNQSGIEVFGRVDQQRLANEMMNAGVWAYTCEFWETFCITALEAQAAGMHVVTSGLCGLLDVVEDKNALVHVPDPWTSKQYVHGPEYKRAFLDKLLPLLCSPKQRPSPVLRDFSWSAVARSWLAYLSKVTK